MLYECLNVERFDKVTSYLRNLFNTYIKHKTICNIQPKNNPSAKILSHREYNSNNQPRHFSHVTTSRISKNLNFKEKPDRIFPRTFLKNRFRHLKLCSNPPKLIGQKSLSYGHLLKDKRLKFTCLRGPNFQVLVRGSSPLKQT